MLIDISFNVAILSNKFVINVPGSFRGPSEILSAFSAAISEALPFSTAVL
ncbi:MAG: hypothetical protein LBT18_02090 [Endomicrobium sp.]|nr:hypothetical protein [Endomicrobium sp.]